MRKFIYAGMLIFLMLPLGCPGNNNPTAPAPTATPIPPVATNTPCGSCTPTQTATSTPTLTPTNSLTSTPTATPSSTPTNTFLPTPVATFSWPVAGSPEGIAISGSSVFVANYSLNKVDKFHLDGTLDGTWTTPLCDRASGVAIDGSGNVYVGNGGLDGTISKFNSQATPVATWSSGGIYGAEVALDGAGHIYLPTSNNNSIQQMSTSGAPGISWPNTDDPNAIAIAGSVVYIGGWINSHLTTYNLSGTSLGGWGLASWSCGAIGVDGLGRVYAVGFNGPIQRFTAAGLLETQWGNYASYGIAFDSSNNIYVSDSNYGVRVFTP